jgi:nickel transport protein
MGERGGVVFALLLFLPVPALAHQLHLFVQPRGATIVGQAYFSPGDVAARQIDVIARDPAGRELGRTKTDDQGNFTLPARVKVDYHLTAEAPGHSDTRVIHAADLPDSLPADSPSSAEAPRPAAAETAPHDVAAILAGGPISIDAQIEALQKQIELLRLQIDKSEQRLRFRDVLGGIGYILGIAGIALYVKSRQNKAPQTRI